MMAMVRMVAVVFVVAVRAVTVVVAVVCDATVTEPTAAGTSDRPALCIVVAAALGIGATKTAGPISAAWLVPTIGFIVDNIDWNMLVVLVVAVVAVRIVSVMPMWAVAVVVAV